MENYLHIFVFVVSFTLIALASKQIGAFFVKVKLPLISGFLFTGILAGPFVLGLISTEATEKLRFVDEISLGLIAFAAGSELYLRELKSRFKSIKWVTIGNIVAVPILGSLTLFLLSDSIPFMQSMPPASRLAICILASSILVARSPSSVIAIVNELRARGPFTQTVIGVTMILDVVVIVLFAISSSVADAVLTGLSFDLGFIGLLAVELVLALLVGYLLARILELILSSPLHRGLKSGLILLSGYGVFLLSAAIRKLSHNQLPFEVLLEPLLICMIGSFITINYGRHRTELLKILHDLGLPVYIAFFTLTGASLALDILVDIWLIALMLFLVRLGAIFIGSFVGGAVAGDPMNHNRISWMSYITQAGVGLGLAKEVAVQFPDWGTAFATIMIAIIVVNQIVGPPFIKWAIQLAGEVHSRAEAQEFDGVRDAIIFGLEGQSLALARQLRLHGWEVKVASRKKHAEDLADNSDIEIHQIPDLDLSAMNQLAAGQAEAIVTMLSDEENYRICELAYEHFGTDNLIVRLNDRANFKRFHDLGALIVEPSTAIVSLLDHFVRSPSAASLLLGMEKDQDIIELEIRNPNLHGIAIRDLRLPLDVNIMAVRRRGQMLISHGYTRLEIGDLVTVVGTLASLRQMMLRFDTNRESEMVQLVEQVTPAELSTRSLESEVKAMIRDRDDHSRSRFYRLIEESVVMDLDRAMTLPDFMTTVANALAPKLKQSPDVLFKLLMEREKKTSTVISKTLAIPHIIIDGQQTFSILLARCKKGIAFSESAPMVQAVFVLVGTRDERNFHLRALSTIAEIVQDSHFEKRWLRAKSEKALRDVVLLRRVRQHG